MEPFAIERQHPLQRQEIAEHHHDIGDGRAGDAGQKAAVHRQHAADCEDGVGCGEETELTRPLDLRLALPKGHGGRDQQRAGGQVPEGRKIHVSSSAVPVFESGLSLARPARCSVARTG